MITLAILNQMVADGVAGLQKNIDFFWEEMPLRRNGEPADGVWLVTRGGDSGNAPKGHNLRQTVDFYVAFANKAKTEFVQAEISKWLAKNMGICELKGSASEKEPTYSYDFVNVRIFQTATPQVAGTTPNGLIVKLASALVIYDLT